ncbi:MAG: rpfC [Phycisphaerales bacterium]|nr:rpfC [Phycisphaerales bacterium]
MPVGVRSSWVLRLLTAVAAVGVACLLRIVLARWLGDQLIYITFFPAVVVAAVVGGFRAGLLAVALSAVAAVFWMAPFGEFRVGKPTDLIGLGIFLVNGVLISWVCERMRRSDVAAAASARAQLEAEKVQQVTSERLVALAEQATAGITATDLTGLFTLVNPRFCEMVGYSAKELLQMRRQEITHPDDVPVGAELFQRLAEQGTPFSVDKRYIRKDGGVVWASVSASPMRGADGIAQGAIGVVIDISERIKAAAEREQLLNSERAARTEAERSNRLKDEFLATLSHELRTPLNAILGWSQILKQSEPESADFADGLSVIERNARIQTQLIEDLLDMSRIITGKVRLEVQRVDLASVIEAAAGSVQPAADAKAIRIQRVLDPLAGPVSGDPNRLQQVVWNLLSNAIKFTPKGGRVQVILARVNSHVEIGVMDNGEGIKPEFLPHVFDRFRQADSTTTRRHGGLGLGLSIVKHLVELHGGRVRVRSDGEGQGSTFTVELPPSPVATDAGGEDRYHPRTASAAPVSFDCAAADLRGVRVLVVEDEPDAREIIRRVLVECNATVHAVESAAEGLDAIRAQTADVLVSDIGLPDLDGYQFIRQVRAMDIDHAAKIPAVALTAFARSEDRTRAMIAGFDVHVAKPVEPAELVAVVARLAGRLR